jgi:sarcosine oxidase
VSAVERAGVVVIGAGGLGSATAWQFARRGVDVVLLERFEFGHVRGASHDTSRILRRSYHTPAYVRLADEAYGDWALLEADAGEPLVTRTGGLDFFPPAAAISMQDYASSLTACAVPFEVLDAAEVATRWPAVRLPAGTVSIYQADTSIVAAGRSTATMQRLARAFGARLHDQSPVTGLVDRGGEVEVVVGPADGTGRTGGKPRRIVAGRVIVTADAWTNDLLAHLGAALPLTVLREQVTYFAPAEPGGFGADRLPVWIWMDDPSFYGFPTYAEGGHAGHVKAAQDCGGEPTTAATRSFDPDPANLDRLARFMDALLPGVGPPAQTVTCLYTLTPDRDFVIDALPGHPDVLVALGAAHGFKFAPTFGRILADLATAGATTSDIRDFAVDRTALVDPAYRPSWLV